MDSCLIRIFIEKCVFMWSTLSRVLDKKNSERRTFFPGLPSTAPTIFSKTPSTLSFTLVFLGVFFVAGARDFVTLPDVVAWARGLEVLAFGLVVVVVFFLRAAGEFVVVVTEVVVVVLRGALWPVAWRVTAMKDFLCWAWRGLDKIR